MCVCDYECVFVCVCMATMCHAPFKGGDVYICIYIYIYINIYIYF